MRSDKAWRAEMGGGNGVMGEEARVAECLEWAVGLTCTDG